LSIGIAAGSTHYFILPYIEQDALARVSWPYAGEQLNICWAIYRNNGVKIYTNPADPSNPSNGMFNDNPWGLYGVTGYGANYQALGHYIRTTNNKIMTMNRLLDGTTNTIFFAEKTAVCQRPVVPSTSNPAPYYNIGAYGRTSWNEWNPVFAYQVTGVASKFQANPTYNDAVVRASTCDPRLAAAPRSSGILVGMGDGGTRLISASVQPDAWWAACTPDGGETLALD
jgi:hypothetical protein